MSKVNNLTTSFIKITNALDKVKNQDEYTIYGSMLDEEELECLKYAQRLRTYNNREAATATPTPTTDTDESKPETKKRGRKNKVVQGEVIDVDMEVNGSEVLPPFPVFRVFALSLISILLLYGEKTLSHLEPLGQNVVRVLVFFVFVCRLLLLSQIRALQVWQCHILPAFICVGVGWLFFLLFHYEYLYIYIFSMYYIIECRI